MTMLSRATDSARVPRLWRRREIPLSRLLLGSPRGMQREDFATRSGDVALPSRSAPRWPRLADLADRVGIQSNGWSGTDVIVKRVRWSSAFVVLEGHDLVADAHGRGDAAVTARVTAGSAVTPLQAALREMSWLEGRRQLYQPVESLDVARWPLVRRCTDRLEMMLEFVASLPALGSTPTSLDVASSYGWFVGAMTAHGFEGYGIERDQQAPTLTQSLYGVPARRIAVGNCEEVLPTRGQFDVVSCLSLLHHFVLNAESLTAEELLRMLAAATRRVLFVDTGESHERWLRKRLHGWTPDFIEQWLREQSDFDDVVRLGADHDDRAPFRGNYGRTLFACVRR